MALSAMERSMRSSRDVRTKISQGVLVGSDSGCGHGDLLCGMLIVKSWNQIQDQKPNSKATDRSVRPT
jgi:hypothetical protein